MDFFSIRKILKYSKYNLGYNTAFFSGIVFLIYHFRSIAKMHVKLEKTNMLCL